MDTFDALLNLYVKGPIDVDLIFALLNKDVPMTDSNLRLKRQIDKLEAVLEGEHKKRLEMFVNLQQRSELLTDALTKVSAFLAESRQENETLRAKHQNLVDIHFQIDQILKDFQRARRVKAPNKSTEGQELPSLFEYRENKDLVVKYVSLPMVHEDLLTVFDFFEDSGDKPSMVLMHPQNYGPLRMFGRDLLDIEASGLMLRLGRMAHLNEVPIYVSEHQPLDEILILGLEHTPRSVAVIRVEREG